MRKRQLLCQLCLHHPATMHITERLPSGEFDERHYCGPCCEAKYLKPPPNDATFPTIRLKLKSVMILVVVFAVSNCVVATLMRSGLVRGTAAQVELWTANAFLSANLLIFCFIFFYVTYDWLHRVTWYRRTGGLVPIPQRGKHATWAGTELVACLFPLFAVWRGVAVSLTSWLLDRVIALQRYEILVLALLMWGPIVAVYAGWLRWSKDPVAQRTRLVWQALPGPERAWRTLSLCWMLGLVVIFTTHPGALWWGSNAWPGVVWMVALPLASALVMEAGAAAFTRRR